MSKPHGNHKPKIYSRYTQKKEKAIQTQDSHRIKRGREEKGLTITNSKQLRKWQ